MSNLHITSVINFCTNEFRFLSKCIEGVRPFSDTILINTCDHYFDGTEENYALLEHAFRLFPDCQFIEYAFDPNNSYRRFTPYFPEHPHWRHEWHNTGRWISYYFLPSACDFILFLDADEIVDAQRFAEWLNACEIMAHSAFRLSAHWYFRKACYRALNADAITLFVKRDALHTDHLWNSDERMGIYLSISGKKANDVLGCDGKPLVDHYSWVRTYEELVKKFTSWGHFWERPWIDLLEAEYAQSFQGKDFIRGYTYETIVPHFDPLDVKIPNLSSISFTDHIKNVSSMHHVTRVDRQQMQRKELLELCL